MKSMRTDSFKRRRDKSTVIRRPTFNIKERKIIIHYEYGGLHDGLVEGIRFGRDYIGSELLELRSMSEH